MKKTRISSLFFYTYYVFLFLALSIFFISLLVNLEISFRTVFGLLFSSALLYFLICHCKHWAQVVMIGEGTLEIRTLMKTHFFKYADILEVRQIEEINRSRGPSPDTEIEIFFVKNGGSDKIKPLRFVPDSKGTTFIRTERIVHPVINKILNAIPSIKYTYIYNGHEIIPKKEDTF